MIYIGGADGETKCIVDTPPGGIELFMVRDPIWRIPYYANISFEVLYEVINVKYICKLSTRRHACQYL